MIIFKKSIFQAKLTQFYKTKIFSYILKCNWIFYQVCSRLNIIIAYLNKNNFHKKYNLWTLWTINIDLFWNIFKNQKSNKLAWFWTIFGNLPKHQFFKNIFMKTFSAIIGKLWKIVFQVISELLWLPFYWKPPKAQFSITKANLHSCIQKVSEYSQYTLWFLSPCNQQILREFKCVQVDLKKLWSLTKPAIWLQRFYHLIRTKRASSK